MAAIVPPRHVKTRKLIVRIQWWSASRQRRQADEDAGHPPADTARRNEKGRAPRGARPSESY